MVVESGEHHESLGQELRRLREQRGWTIEAAAKATKIRTDQIEDIEADNYTNFPSVAYVRGFVRIYARTLGLDDRKVVARLDGKIHDTREHSLATIAAMDALAPVSKSRAGRHEGKRKFGERILGFMAFLFLASIGGMIYKIGGFKDYSAPAPQPSVAKGVPVESATNIPKAEPIAPAAVPVAPRAVPIAPAAVPVEQEVKQVFAVADENVPRAEPVRPTVRLALESRAEVWLRVIVNGDESAPVFDGMIGAGKSVSWSGQSFFIEARPPSALMVSFNGEPMRPLSADTNRGKFTFPQ